MTTLRHEVRIDAPVGKVWNVMADLLAVQRYNPTVASARYTSDQRQGVGAGRRCELKPEGWVEERVWDWQPPRAIGLEVAASDWPIAFMRWRTELRPDGDATVATQEMTYRMKLGPLGALLDALLMRRRLDQGVRLVFDGLKRHVESST